MYDETSNGAFFFSISATKRQRKICIGVCGCVCERESYQRVAGYPCGFNYCSIVAGLS